MFKLREHALKEKTQAELAWLEQQKKRLRSKGEDDAYPQIRKKQRGLIMRLQQEQAQLKRLREANRVASRERHLLILQQQEIQRLKQTAQQVKKKELDRIYFRFEHTQVFVVSHCMLLPCGHTVLHCVCPSVCPGQVACRTCCDW